MKGLVSFSRFTILTFGGVVALGCCFCPKKLSEGPGVGGGVVGVGGGVGACLGGGSVFLLSASR